MKNLFLLSFLFLLACSGEEQSKDIYAAINEEVMQHSRAYEDLKEETSVIGHRLTGSENGARAEQFVHDKLIEYGFTDVKFQEFEVVAWSRESITTSVTINGQTAMDLLMIIRAWMKGR